MVTRMKMRSLGRRINVLCQSTSSVAMFATFSDLRVVSNRSFPTHTREDQQV
ncbi:hypothetical protein WN48_09846 [Eufriesea mexicana]|uniref:Uncharacterized protein n=1 Tax=Eufriesea mexicana TaxID=516756 RepID=A0A310SIE8_9HYME|nr:hypothetical protein WN48_09846 [Eufriesea mexicana]